MQTADLTAEQQTEHDHREWMSGYEDGRRGLSFIHGESSAYQQGWHAGAMDRANR